MMVAQQCFQYHRGIHHFGDYRLLVRMAATTLLVFIRRFQYLLGIFLTEAKYVST
jgi:hypothetical protein